MKRVAAFVYGLASYLTFFVTFLYAIGFVANAVVPKSIDTGTVGAFWPSLLINLGLLGLFGVQHSGMARPAFKRWWTRLVPAPIERSTYVLFASLALIVLFWLWRPLPQVVWSVENEAGRALLWGLNGLGWGLVLLATLMISHAHLFGVRQVRDYLKGEEPWNPGFQTPGLYRHVRHPIMVGFFIAFWATPGMSQGHLLFAVVTSVYILVALQLEERDLLRAFGERYQMYRSRVPMLLPRLGRRQAARERSESAS
jgi:protein-S-isoprenylcysteine O-methyltransferase Ste14